MTILPAIESRSDLTQFGSNRAALFALQIEFAIEDIHTVAADAIVDGPDDKGCDIFYLDEQTGRAIICQSYESTNPAQAAKSNKAGQLSQTVQWLISTKTIPQRLQAAARDLQGGIKDGLINTVELWYVHNCPESSNVGQELARAESALTAALRLEFPDSEVASKAKEIGKATLDEIYKSTQVSIDIEDELIVDIQGAFEASGEEWSSICCSIPGSWLKLMFDKYGDKLFSANVRSYLGSRKSDKNINNGIKETVAENPVDFWAFNNGITALVNYFEYNDETGTLKSKGMAIVNGAQTTGSIASADAELDDVKVMARFVRCNNTETVTRIIRYNNRQNKVEPSDFRSNDRIQTRLRKEFDELGHLKYSGGRRGSIADIIERPGDREVPASSAAQALAAFHGDPNLAYNRKRQIWESDADYSSVFNDKVTARHIIFTYALLKTIDEERIELRQVDEGERRDTQRSQANFLSQRGATYLLMAAISASLESVLQCRIESSHSLAFSADVELRKAVENWKPIVDLVLPLTPNLTEATEAGLKSKIVVERSIATFTGTVEAISSTVQDTLQVFAQKTEIISNMTIK